MVVHQCDQISYEHSVKTSQPGQMVCGYGVWSLGCWRRSIGSHVTWMNDLHGNCWGHLVGKWASFACNETNSVVLWFGRQQRRLDMCQNCITQCMAYCTCRLVGFFSLFQPSSLAITFNECGMECSLVALFLESGCEGGKVKSGC